MDGHWRDSFRRLPFMLADLKDANVGTSVDIEVDQGHEFCVDSSLSVQM